VGNHVNNNRHYLTLLNQLNISCDNVHRAFLVHICGVSAGPCLKRRDVSASVAQLTTALVQKICRGLGRLGYIDAKNITFIHYEMFS